jgi:hypothetical protein
VPLGLLCDRRDFGSSSEGGRLYLYDFAEGGIGLAEKAYHVLEQLLGSALALLRGCPCSDGCPSCMQIPGCPRGNNGLDKIGGAALLEGHSVGGARVTHTVLASERGPASAGTVRRSRLRRIADEDRRERYGLSPGWLEVGGLAQSEADGLVIVWAIGRGMAQVQRLSGGGDSHWVPIKDLREPRADWWRDRKA